MDTGSANNEALPLFYKAIELDPNFASAYGMAARCYAPAQERAGWVTDRAYEIAETARLARRAGELGRDDAVALCTAGIALAFVVGDLDDGAAYIDRALVLNPNLAGAWLVSGWVKVWLGEPEVAIEREARAMRLSPHDPHDFQSCRPPPRPRISLPAATPRRCHGRKCQCESNRTIIHSTSVAAASAALAGNHAAAAKAMARLRQLMPELRISNLKDLCPIRRAEDFDRWAEGMGRMNA